MKKIGIYIHIPFCKSKCPYCNFYSVKAQEQLIKNYIDTVVKQIEQWSKKLDVSADTLYIGGGTPSSVGSESIVKIIDSVTNNFNLNNPEITVECNPSDDLEEFFYSLSNAGVNRISMGLQSAVDSEREELGRKATVDDVTRDIEYAKKAGINNISLDVMLGIPNQTKESLQKTLDYCINSDIKHISAYMLKIEKGTRFYKIKDLLTLPDDDKVCDFYLQTCEELEKAGFNQYEISNFSEKGYESKHNLKYWDAREYIGIGASAHSFINGSRFFNGQKTDEYIENCIQIPDGNGGSFEEYVLLRLRLTDGLLQEETLLRYKHKIPDKMIEEAQKLEKQGFLTCDDNGIRLTKKGFLVSNTIIFKLLSTIN